jgi:hypothetical protein
VKRRLLWVGTVLLTVGTTIAWLGKALEGRPSVGESTDQQLLFVWICVAVETVAFVALVASSHLGRKLVAIGLALMLVVTPAAAATFHIQSTSAYRATVRDEAAALAPACTSASPIAQAAVYGGPAPHLLAVLDDSGHAGDWTNHAIDLGWQQTAAESAQLVVCLGAEKRTSLQVCEYSAGSSVTRWRYDRVVVIVEASTGRELGRQSFEGRIPDMCPYTKSSGSEDMYGSELGWDTTAIWNYINDWESGPTR